jgi:uncharacterized membrane protein (UPF0127 family)
MVICFLIVLPAAACNGDDQVSSSRNGGETQAPPGAPEFPSGKLLIDMGADSRLIDVEIAETDEQRAYGLMNRDELEADRGMVFVYFENTSGGFWMKDTRIPLSIAFFDVDGRILEILDMAPCRRESCKVYAPGVTYRGALEVNQGAFERWGVEEGDRISLLPRSQ